MTIKTWGEALDWNWTNKWKRLKSATTNKINSNHVTTYGGRSMPLARMSKGHWWVEFQNELLEANPSWSTSTVNRVTSAARTVLNNTYKAGLHNVAPPPFDRLKEGEARYTYFTKDQVERMAFIAATKFDSPDLGEAIIISAYAGPRQGELLNLKREDVDLAANRLWIGGKPKRETKGKNVRAVPIHPLVQSILNNRLDREYLFRDDWANKDQLYNLFKKVRDYCDIPADYVWHSLRHSFATWLGEHNSPRAVMELCGHADVQTTMRYMKPTDEAANAAILSI